MFSIGFNIFKNWPGTELYQGANHRSEKEENIFYDEKNDINGLRRKV